MLKFTIVATFALFLSSFPSLIHALPTSSASSSTIVGQVPTVTNLQGVVDPQLFQENLHQTFAKYRFVPVADNNATSTLTNGTDSLRSRRVYQKRGEDLPTRIGLAVITEEPAIGLVRACPCTYAEA